MKILDDIEQNPCASFGIDGRDRLVWVVADAAGATDEDHADIGHRRHRRGIVAGTARQLEDTSLPARDGGSDLVAKV